jgi:hypothetical protein
MHAIRSVERPQGTGLRTIGRAASIAAMSRRIEAIVIAGGQAGFAARAMLTERGYGVGDEAVAIADHISS